jgi:hypothetical protein
MIKTSQTGYVTLNTFTHFREIAIPLGKTRLNENGEREALMLAFMCGGGKREVWVSRKDLYTGSPEPKAH